MAGEHDYVVVGTGAAGAVVARRLAEKPRVSVLLLEAGQTIYPPVGSCRMGRDGAAVVGPDLRLRGVERLRVADASVMPAIVRGDTQAASHMIGERAAELTLKDAAAAKAAAAV